MALTLKLQRDGHTRLVVLHHPPSWAALAAKINALYHLPPHAVAVSYLDADNDEITLSSDQEFADYLASLPSNTPARLNVLDLSVSRPPSSPNRNTFGHELEDWHPFNPDDFSDPPHAFVEILPSDASAFGKDSTDAQSTVQLPFDKGKARATSLSGASVASVVAEEPADKYPIHVANVIPPAVTQPTAATTVPEEQKTVPPAHAASVADLAEDPPLAELPSVSPSLVQDIASLMTAFTGVISSHPELSEGIRNIVRNATDGTYWQAHRASLSHAVNNLSQTSAADAARIEHEAAQRISEALGSFFQALSPAPAPQQDPQPADPAVSDQPVPPAHPPLPPPPPPHPWHSHWYGPGRWRHPRPPPPHHPYPHPIPFMGPFGRFPPPFPPPPPPPGQSRQPDVGNPFSDPPLPSQPSALEAKPLSSQPPSRMTGEQLLADVENAKRIYKERKEIYRRERERRKNDRETSRVARQESSDSHQTAQSTITPLPSLQVGAEQGEQRSLDDAMRMYPPATEVADVLNTYVPADGPSFSSGMAPRRANTLPTGRVFNGDLYSRAQNRIARRLADMGFSETLHPSLPEKIKAQLPSNGVLSKDKEDDVVTNLLEELLSAKPPVASGSALPSTPWD